MRSDADRVSDILDGIAKIKGRITDNVGENPGNAVPAPCRGSGQLEAQYAKAEEQFQSCSSNP
jgi:hypothetical protein